MGHSTPEDLKKIRITDAFWGNVQERVRTEVIPYQWEALNDRIPDAEPSFCIHNFRAAARLMERKHQGGSGFAEPVYTFRGFQSLPEDPEHPDPERFYGFVFQDSDFFKWIEAVGYSLAQHSDPELERIADGAIDLICAAQHDSGYLDTYYILNGMDRAFTDLKNHHELYCLGHLIEGAAAYFQATGKDKLLRAACRYADYVDSRFGPESGKCKGYPGHEIAEMALVRLYELTREERYLKLSRFFLDQRGTEPLYFAEEDRLRAEHDGLPAPKDDPAQYQYFQAHRPVREQDEALGHAVRAVYLYSGMADVARLTGDEGLLNACRRLWDSIVREKLYVTGGIGGAPDREAFSYPYDLPNEIAYSESCAAIGLAFFARRMLELAPLREYGDVMEQALYNTVLAGMALDGKSFFYVNPLEVHPEACRRDERLSHVKTVRQKWFGCACCPPNIARIAASLGSYIYTQDEDTLWVHLYIGNELDRQIHGADVKFVLESGLPWSGAVRMTVRASAPVAHTLAFRIPGWCGPDRPEVAVPAGIAQEERDGYLYLTGTWRDGDQAAFTFPMKPRLLQANPRVRADQGKAAVACGPLTYCMEQADNGSDLNLCRIDAAHFSDTSSEPLTIGGQQMLLLTVPGYRQPLPAPDAPLYQEYAPPVETPVQLRYVPYYAWANRGEGEMQVWTRV